MDGRQERGQPAVMLCLAAISLLGFVSIIIGVDDFVRPVARPYDTVVIVISVLFLAMARWSVHLPSGASWRPAMGFVMVGMFILPWPLGPLVAVPGLVFITALARAKWWQYLFTIGHITAGLYVGAWTFHAVCPSIGFPLPAVLPAAVLGLIVHFTVNRIISALMIAYRQNSSVRKQLAKSLQEVSWGHYDLYLISIISAIMYAAAGVWGLFLAAALLVGLFQSVTYYTRMHMWQQAASTDGLTGVGNRTAWERFATRMAWKPAAGTLAVIDVDSFKAINDVHGHPAGDDVLRTIAQGLYSQLRKTDQVCRYGGDEFVVFVEHDAGADVVVRQQLNRALSQACDALISRGIPVSVSVGTAVIPKDADAVEEAFAIADQRMYSMKEHSKVLSPTS